MHDGLLRLSVRHELQIRSRLEGEGQMFVLVELGRRAERELRYREAFGGAFRIVKRRFRVDLCAVEARSVFHLAFARLHPRYLHIARESHGSFPVVAAGAKTASSVQPSPEGSKSLKGFVMP